MSTAMNHEAIHEALYAQGARARSAFEASGSVSEAARTRALSSLANLLRTHTSEILAANASDLNAARASGLAEAMCDRLVLHAARIEALANGVDTIAARPAVIGVTLEEWHVPSGLKFARVSVPIGVIGMIYEARPGVTIDAAALCIKSGNAVILRGGSECFHSNAVLVTLVQRALSDAGLPEHLVQMVGTTDRAGVEVMLAMSEHLDVLIPRGGKSLTEKVAREARMPTMLHLTGNCHSYLHASADLEAALPVIINAKMRRTSVCGATESLLIDAAVARSALPLIVAALQAKGCEIVGCNASRAIDPRIEPAAQTDWAEEYLRAKISVKIVADTKEAIYHINHYGSHHTDAILARDEEAIAAFCQGIDSAVVMVNTSTQFADGGEFGFGGEIGIATGRLSPRGPVAARELTTYKTIVRSAHMQRP